MNSLYVIYGLRHKNDKKIRYVGLTIRGAKVRFDSHFNDLNRNSGNNNSNRPICNWLRKYSKNEIEYVILEECPFGDLDYLNYAEKYWITSLREFNYNLLNLADGGKASHNKLSIEHKEKIKKGVQNYFDTYGHKAVYDIWLEKYGKEKADILREEKRKKASKSISGSGNPMYGRTGEAAPCFGRTGKKHPLFGKKHSPETIEKMRLANSGRQWSISSKLKSSFTQHLKNHTINKKIKCIWCAGAILENEIKKQEKELDVKNRGLG